jgi:hypothetical protein
MWYFGARIVGSEFLLDRSLQDMVQFKNTIRGCIARLEATSNAATELGDKCGSKFKAKNFKKVPII